MKRENMGRLLRTKWARLVAFLIGVIILISVVTIFEPIYSTVCRYNEYWDQTRCTPEYVPVAAVWYVARFFDRVSAFATAAATVGLVVVTFLLVRLGQEQGNTTRAQLRAYVLVEEARIENTGLGENARSVVKIKNFGQTPA